VVDNEQEKSKNLYYLRKRRKDNSVPRIIKNKSLYLRPSLRLQLHRQPELSRHPPNEYFNWDHSPFIDVIVNIEVASFVSIVVEKDGLSDDMSILTTPIVN